jgi:hypothetical protein
MKINDKGGETNGIESTVGYFLKPALFQGTVCRALAGCAFGAGVQLVVVVHHLMTLGGNGMPDLDLQLVWRAVPVV